MKCFITKWLISLSLDNTDGIHPLAEKHLAKCTKCRQWHETQQRINQNLSASEKHAYYSPYLETKIIKTISSLKTETDATPYQIRLAIPALVSVAVCLIIAIGVIFLKERQFHNEKHAYVLESSSFKTISPLPYPDITLVKTIVADIFPSNVKEIIPDPYRKEINLLLKDMQNAANFAAACLPINISG